MNPFLCNNKQCKSCKYASDRSTWISCHYILTTGHSRGCDIPYCKRWEPVSKRTKKPQLTDKDFEAWYAAYGKDGNGVAKVTKNSMKVVLIEDGKIIRTFGSRASAARALGYTSKTIKKYCEKLICFGMNKYVAYETDEESVMKALKMSAETLEFEKILYK